MPIEKQTAREIGARRVTKGWRVRTLDLLYVVESDGDWHLSDRKPDAITKKAARSLLSRCRKWAGTAFGMRFSYRLIRVTKRTQVSR